MELKRIGILSFGKIAGILGVIYGFLVGIFFTIVLKIGASQLQAQMGELQTQMGGLAGLGYLSILVLPILYGILYFIGGVISAALYNVIARWVGGIELELQK